MLPRKRSQSDFDAEIAAHLALEEDRLISEGMKREEAHATARRRFRNVTAASERFYFSSPWSWLEQSMQDVRYSFRKLISAPLFTAAAVLPLAIAMGAATAVFSLLNALVLRPLPVNHPEQLVWFRDPSFSYPIFQEVRRRSNVFSGMFGWNQDRGYVAWAGEPIQTPVLTVSGGYFSTLGIQPASGRFFDEEDDRPGAPGQFSAVISYTAWQRRFGGNSSAIGASIQVEQTWFTTIGVTPAEFFGIAAGRAPEITIPLTTVPLLKAEQRDALSAWSSSWLLLVARLKPGVSREQADAAIQVIWPHVLEATTPERVPGGRRGIYLGRRTGLEPGRTGFSAVRRQFSTPLAILLGLVGMLFAAACANAGNLMLVRAENRRREMAIRLSLGAGRRRLVRQLLTEGLILALTAGLAGVLLAQWTSTALLQLLSTSYEQISLSTRADLRVLAFAGGLVAASTLLFGLIPAFKPGLSRIAASLKESTGGIVGRRWQWSAGRALVAGQIALSMVLLVGAGLFVKSLSRLLTLDPGFRMERILVAHLDATSAGYDATRLTAFYDAVLARIRNLAGVDAASLSWIPPISNEKGSWTQHVTVEGRALPEGGTGATFFNAVSPEYFATVGTRLLMGRDFRPQDQVGAPRVVIVNETLASELRR